MLSWQRNLRIGVVNVQATKNESLKVTKTRFDAIRRGWQKDYFHGKDPGDAESFVEHQTKLKIEEFRET